jgi:hypothetical protein
MAIKYEQIIPGMVVCRELDITIIKLYGSWNVQKSGNYVQGFDRLKDAKAFLSKEVSA